MGVAGCSELLLHFNRIKRHHIPSTKTLVPFGTRPGKLLNPLLRQLCVPHLLIVNNKVFYPAGTLSAFVCFPEDHQSTYVFNPYPANVDKMATSYQC